MMLEAGAGWTTDCASCATACVGLPRDSTIARAHIMSSTLRFFKPRPPCTKQRNADTAGGVPKVGQLACGPFAAKQTFLPLVIPTRLHAGNGNGAIAPESTIKGVWKIPSILSPRG